MPFLLPVFNFLLICYTVYRYRRKKIMKVTSEGDIHMLNYDPEALLSGVL